jgi:hypothetical protein
MGGVRASSTVAVGIAGPRVSFAALMGLLRERQGPGTRSWRTLIGPAPGCDDVCRLRSMDHSLRGRQEGPTRSAGQLQLVKDPSEGRTTSPRCEKVSYLEVEIALPSHREQTSLVLATSGPRNESDQ